MKKRSKLLNPRAAAWAQIQTQYQAAILTNTYRETTGVSLQYINIILFWSHMMTSKLIVMDFN